MVSFTYWVQSAVEEHIAHEDTAGRIIMVFAQLPAGPALASRLSQAVLRDRKR